jgi:hypothetical protein
MSYATIARCEYDLASTIARNLHRAPTHVLMFDRHELACDAASKAWHAAVQADLHDLARKAMNLLVDLERVSDELDAAVAA